VGRGDVGIVDADGQSVGTDEQSTVIRLRGQIRVSGIPNAAADNDVIGLGIIVVSDAAFGVGGLSVPGPIADPDAPWIWHQYVPIDVVSETVAKDTSLGALVTVEVDSKAMRRFGANETLIIVGEIATPQTFSSVVVNGGVRALILNS